MPGFSLKWTTTGEGNQPLDQSYGITADILKTMNCSWEKELYDNAISQYQTFISKYVRYHVVRKAKQYNMTNEDIWTIISSWKREAIQTKVFTCKSNAISRYSLESVFYPLGRRITPQGPKVKYTETPDDLKLAFDIFSYMVHCQNEAMELQIFFENLLRTETPQTILQATVNTLKLKHKHKTAKITLHYLYKELSSMMDLKLSKTLTALIESSASEGQKGLKEDQHQRDLFDGTLWSSWDDKDLNMLAGLSSNPVAIQDKQGTISPSTFIPIVPPIRPSWATRVT